MDRDAAYRLLGDCFAAGLEAVDPERCVAEHLDPVTVGPNPTVLALGKAAPAMARGAARALGVKQLDGVVVSNHAAATPDGLELILGNHPVPGEGSLAGGRALLNAADRLGEGDVALVLISGGGSAIAELPVAGVTLRDIAATNDLLLRCGADIEQTNTIRRRLSSLKAGGLAAAISPARLVTLVISDVVGDSLQTIASGPTVAGSDRPESALEVVEALDIAEQLPPAVMKVLGEVTGSPFRAPDQVIKVIAGGSVAAHAAAASARQQGFPAAVIDTRLVGEASLAAAEALDRRRGSVSVYAGETTVNVTGDGIGGRNHEAALTAATLLEGRSGLFFLAAGTDGIDGSTDAAGAIADGTTLHRARAQGLSAAEALGNNDSGNFFAALGDQVITGPTGTNVGDLWIVFHAA
jgi:hydroxypyruvate reductase